MTIKEAALFLEAEILHDNFSDKIISSVYTSDLLSDVMANSASASVLVTIQAHLNTVAVAVHKKISAIIICNSRPVPQDMLDAAKEERIALLSVKENQFFVSGKLYGEINPKKKA